MHSEIRRHSEGVSIMWPLTHISAGLDPERGMITANGIWLSINQWTAISPGCWGRLHNAVIVSICTQVAARKAQTHRSWNYDFFFFFFSYTMTNTGHENVFVLSQFSQELSFLFPSQTHFHMNHWTHMGLSHPMMPLFTFQRSPGLTGNRTNRNVDSLHRSGKNTLVPLVMIPGTCLPRSSEMPHTSTA